MDEYNTDIAGAEEQGFAEPDAAAEEAEAVNIDPTGAEEQELAEPVNETRKTDADAAFAELRRRAEQAERQQETAAEQNRRMTDILKTLGFRGENADEMADDALAHLTQRPVDEIRRERTAAEYQKNKTQAIIDELNFYREKEAQRMLDEDLAVFRKIDPSIKTDADLAARYPNYLNAVKGFNSDEIKQPEMRELLFRMEYERQAASRSAAPPKIGKVNEKTNVEREYFTSKELDKLTKADLDDPVLLEKAIKSMTKLR